MARRRPDLPGQRRILFVVDEWSACAWYRCNVPARELQKYGHQVALLDSAPQEMVAEADVVVFLRHFSLQALEAMRAAKRMGKLVVYDIDDALWEITTDNPAYRLFSSAEVKRGMNACIQAADIVTTTTQPLARLLKGRHPNVLVLPNMLPAEVWPFDAPKQQRDEQVVIGWAGGHSHYQDLSTIGSAINDVLDAHPTAYFAYTGLAEVPFPAHERIVPIQGSPIDQYAHLLRNFDIGIAAVQGTKFNRCKSDLKALEYSMAGIPVVATDIETYNGFVKDGETGFLVKTESDWREALTRLVEDRELRSRMGRSAQEAARARLIAANIGLWQEAYGLERGQSAVAPNVAASSGGAVVPPAPAPGKGKPLIRLLPSKRGSIDVVMPVYNCAEYLHAAVESIERQTIGVDRIRLIAVDDGSTDASREVLEQIAAASPLTVDLVVQPKNGGANVARNAGLGRGDGEFVYFMDADALLRADAFERLSAALTLPGIPMDIGFAFSAFKRLWVPNGQFKTADGRIGVEDVHPGAYDIGRLKAANYISMMSLVRRSALPSEGFDLSIERFQDWDMWLTLYQRGLVGVYVPEMLFYAYVRGGGISEDRESYARLQQVVARKHFG